MEEMNAPEFNYSDIPDFSLYGTYCKMSRIATFCNGKSVREMSTIRASFILAECDSGEAC